MSRLMQLSNFYIRGAIATQTMAGLTEQQIKRVDDIVCQVENDEAIAGDRYQFIKQLGATIKGDYRSDPLTAVQEFRIAIWRATVHLLYHRDYSYNCTLCGATEYQTSAGKPKAFDRQYKICPHCETSLCNTDEGRIKVTVIRRDRGYSIIKDDGKIIALDLSKQDMEDTLYTPISTILGPKKVEDPEKILNDATQRSKWYVTWVWNYFRQILNENIIKTHNKHQVEISGPADQIAFQILVNELKRIHHRYNYDEGINIGLTDELVICTEILHTEPSFSNMLEGLKKEFRPYNVEITNCRSAISITRTGEVQNISTVIESEDQVIVLSFTGPSNNQSEGQNNSWSDVIEHKSTGHIYDGRIDDLISDEAMSRVRMDLHDPKAMVIFDILSQTGENWREFSSRWGTQPARKAHIAEFIQVSPKQVDQIKQQIATQCTVHGLR